MNMKKKDVFPAMLMALAMVGTGLSCSNDKEDLDLTIENENNTPQEEVEVEVVEEELADSTDFSISLGDVPTGYSYKKPENSNPEGRHRTPRRDPSL